MARAIELIGITKRFPGVVANDHVDLAVEEGEIHAICGENGAGKSTLMKILYGMQAPDEGEMRVFGNVVHFTKPTDAINLGIGMVHQHFMLAENLTVLESVVLGAEPTLRGGRLDFAGAKAHIHEVAHALFDILQIPVLGPEEEAADTVSAILMLFISKEEARRMIIAGAAYIYKDDLKSDVTLQLADFSDVHSTPQQRFFNLLCIAYGVNQEMFSDLVKKGYLPEDRAVGCENEAQLAFFAYSRLIKPHIDMALARQVLAKQWVPDVNRRLPQQTKAPKSSTTNGSTP